MVDIRWEGGSQKSASQNGHKVTEAGTAEGIRCTAPRESALVKLLAA